MKAKEIREWSEAELSEKEKELSQELFNLRFRHASGQSVSTARMVQIKRDLARVKTIRREKERSSEGTAETGKGERRARL